MRERVINLFRHHAMKTIRPFRPGLCRAAGLGLLTAGAMASMVQAQPPQTAPAPGQALPQTQSQSFQPIAPKLPPKPGPGRVVNEEEEKSLGGHGDTDVLVDHLKGIFLLSDPKQVRRNGVKNGQTVVPGDIALARDPDFNEAVQPYIGQPVTLKSLAELTRSIVSFFRDHDRPVVNVFVPEQSITSGFVQVVVVISRVEKVEATGAHYFSNEFLRRQVRLHPGEPISGRQLANDVNWINRNPFLQSDVLLAPGNTPGTTDLLLRTQDRIPFRLYAGYEDSGNQFTGDDRILTGFNYGNLFGVGQQLSYQFTTGTNVNKFTAHSGTYVIPLPWRHQLTFFGSYANSSASLGPDLSTGGVNWQVSGRYEIPLPGTDHFTESVTGGFDFKRSNNDLIFGVATVSNVFTDVDQFVLSYQASYQDPYGSTSASATGFWSPGGMSNNNDDADYVATRGGSRSNYAYAQFTLNRVTRLPYDFTLTVRGEVQQSDANLLPSEQLGLGGYATVRGYDERESNGDNGYLISTELATPPVSIGEALGLKAVKDQLQFLGFIDYGGTSLHQLTPADVNPNTNLLGVGPGLRYVINPYVSIRFDYGFQLIDTGFDNRHNSRAHLGVLVSY
jgi:hemolysin activation/secretion protein